MSYSFSELRIRLDASTVLSCSTLIVMQGSLFIHKQTKDKTQKLTPKRTLSNYSKPVIETKVLKAAREREEKSRAGEPKRGGQRMLGNAPRPAQRPRRPKGSEDLPIWNATPSKNAFRTQRQINIFTNTRRTSRQRTRPAGDAAGRPWGRRTAVPGGHRTYTEGRRCRPW